MHDASKGKIFLASERGHTETDWFRSYNTFNFGQYQHEHKQPFGPLYVLNDDTLAGKRTIKLLVEEASVIVLLPVVGAIIYKDSNGNRATLEAGEVQFFFTPKGTTVEICNPFETELINYLQLWLKCSSEQPSSRLIAFDIESDTNRLIELLSFRSASSLFVLKASIGIFDGREEAVYKLSNTNHGLFVFVLQGAFEVQNRLLETRDGLALWDIEEIELEALSNEAIILLIEIRLD